MKLKDAKVAFTVDGKCDQAYLSPMQTKQIAVTLENLSNGNIRATVRNNGRTVSWKDGSKGTERALLAAVMAEGCESHRLAGGYDLTHIELNDAAKAVYA